MTFNNRRGTFWVIDGIRVKKKCPFAVTEVQRIFQIDEPKPSREQPLPNQEILGITEQKHFFTEKSYENFADKRMDYGMIRFSSLSSMKGGQLFSWGINQEMPHNFSVVSNNSPQNVKRSIFQNQFIIFDYPIQVQQSMIQN